jgi:hypothetical protein
VRQRRDRRRSEHTASPARRGGRNGRSATGNGSRRGHGRQRDPIDATAPEDGVHDPERCGGCDDGQRARNDQRDATPQDHRRDHGDDRRGDRADCTIPRATDRDAAAECTAGPLGRIRRLPDARYSLELDGLKFIVRGPVDTDPNRISVACDVADLDASASGDRLVIDRPVPGRPSSFVLGFVGTGGGTPKAIAARIMESAERARRANT